MIDELDGDRLSTEQSTPTGTAPAELEDDSNHFCNVTQRKNFIALL